ncbi:hypothetical protein PPSIR1_03963 [Plesiocystis pacifica SIR-1]|uniref:Zinc-finger domain-containing protein n=1 Tax=Plesiocystis pacifica SIR-1 TaxID=391625 RepID=A6G4F1_9BACT|nr:hypothetical protein [Plesiocystis pacifica]EDM79263.1 hypothetical protein PPSIR1_03963 [Plesiocystis pacifica SIR-1]
MTLEPGAPERAEFIPSLQPFVDGELDEREHERVAAEIAANPEYQAFVKEQQEVRALLRSLDREPVPEGLAARVQAGLDTVDAERSREGGALAPIVGRIKAFGRGTMLMVPAAAAAVALFFGVRSGALDELMVVGGDEAHVDGGMANSLRVPTHRAKSDDEPAPTKAGEAQPAPSPEAAEPEKEAPEPDERGLAEVEEQGFAIQVARSSSLPPGTALVSDDPSGTTALVRYRAGERIVADSQSLARSVQARGTRQVFRGEAYYLGRDAEGRARVEFVHGAVLHSLTFEAGELRPGAPVSADDPDAESLLSLGVALREGLGG